jgi:hypothetical protein
MFNSSSFERDDQLFLLFTERITSDNALPSTDANLDVEIKLSKSQDTYHALEVVNKKAVLTKLHNANKTVRVKNDFKSVVELARCFLDALQKTGIGFLEKKISKVVFDNLIPDEILNRLQVNSYSEDKVDKLLKSIVQGSAPDFDNTALVKNRSKTDLVLSHKSKKPCLSNRDVNAHLRDCIPQNVCLQRFFSSLYRIVCSQNAPIEEHYGIEKSALNHDSFTASHPSLKSLKLFSQHTLIYFKKPRLGSLVDGTNVYFHANNGRLFVEYLPAIATMPMFRSENDGWISIDSNWWDGFTTRISGTSYFIGGDPEYSDWFGFFVPKLVWLAEFMNTADLTLVLTKQKNFMRESISTILPNAKILELEPPTPKSFTLYHFEHIFVPPHPGDFKAYNFLRSINWSRKPAGKTRRNHKLLYIRQSPSAHGYSRIQNEEEIFNFLISVGFHVIEPSQLQLAEKYAIISNAEIVFSIYGSTAFNYYMFHSVTSALIMPMLPRLRDSLSDSDQLYRWNKIISGRLVVAELMEVDVASAIPIDFNTPGILTKDVCRDAFEKARALVRRMKSP